MPDRTRPDPQPGSDAAALIATRDEPLVAAVSGGGDSLALLLHLRAASQGRALNACVVDHGLRPGSAAEAEAAAALCRPLCDAVRIVTLTWPDGPRSAQAQARRARYGALAEAAAAWGATVVHLGHTFDDQAETTLMRIEAGTGPRGLAAMQPLSPCPIWPEGRDLWLARPLLDTRRAALRETLRAAGMRWIEDPSNELDRYTRVRVRRKLAESGEAEALVQLARASAAVVAREDAAALALLAASVTIDGDAAALAMKPAPDDPVQVRLVGALATALGGAEREPSAAAVRRILARLANGEGGGLAGACFRPGPPVRICRDPGGVNGRRGGGRPLPPLGLDPGRPAVWDSRLALEAPEPGWTARSGPTPAAPILQRGDRAFTVAEAQGAGVSASWLTAVRARRLLWRGARLADD